MQRVLVVTGASKGIGLEVVLEALAQGYTVVGTSRNAQALEEAVATARQNSTKIPANAVFKAISMNFTEADIHQSLKSVVDEFGRIDVLVNNAGYAILGAVEEFSMEEVRKNFDVNFFGLFSCVQAVLPYMRKQNYGRIINIASISGTVTGATQGIYSATKAAVIMLTEALNAEVNPFNVYATAICPGGVRTDFLDSGSSLKLPEKKILEYAEVERTMEGLRRLNGNQSGDPVKVAKAIVDISKIDNPPGRLYLGSGALAALNYKINEVVQSANEFAEISLSTDFQGK